MQKTVTISEFIAQLESFKKEHGDLPILLKTWNGEEFDLELFGGMDECFIMNLEKKVPRYRPGAMDETMKVLGLAEALVIETV